MHIVILILSAVVLVYLSLEENEEETDILNNTITKEQNQK